MKYKVLSIVVIIFTFISVNAMIFCQDIVDSVGQITNELKRGHNTKMEEKSNVSPTKEIQANKVVVETKENSDNNLKQTIEENNEKAKNTTDNSTKTLKTEKSDSKKTVEKSGVEVQSNSYKTVEEYPDSVAVFKIAANEIINEISAVDKTKIFIIAKKISPMDYAKINNYLQDSNKGRGITNTFALLKMRLSEKDYERIKDIAEKYINVDKIESFIK